MKRPDSPRALRVWLLAFFAALAIPAGVLIHQAFEQLKWQSVHQSRELAMAFARQVDERLSELIRREDARSYGDYSFLTVTGDAQSNFLQRSPLSELPPDNPMPGLIGYFQVDPEGNLSSPVVPPRAANAPSYGIGNEEFRERLSLESRIRSVLMASQTAQSAAGEKKKLAMERRAVEVPEAAEQTGRPDDLSARGQRGASMEDEDARSDGKIAQSAFDALQERDSRTASERPVEEAVFDRLNTGRTPSSGPAAATAPEPERARAKRQEKVAVLEAKREFLEASADRPWRQSDLRVTTFQSEIDPLSFSHLDSGHFLLFRNAWPDGERHIQGLLIDQEAFLNSIVGEPFRGSAAAQRGQVSVRWRGEPLATYPGSASAYAISAEPEEAQLIAQTRLSAPASELMLAFRSTRLPLGPAAGVLFWTALALFVVLVAGLVGMYRLGLRQLHLAQQQQDFVSAVSHELKTPLTSIRMYGEVLKEGWADEEKRRQYYEYIHDEAERLTHLINNVLQLARLSRDESPCVNEPIAVAELMDLVHSKIAGLIERRGFSLDMRDETAGDCSVCVDSDCFAQAVINLVDNAAKFSREAETRAVDITARSVDGTVSFSVRDYGPGIPKDQLKKIFRRFYRPAGELTRNTVGTGIGLSLVHELTLAMGGSVDVRNRQPGVEFSLSFPALKEDPKRVRGRE